MAAPRPFYTWDPTLYYTHGHRLHYMLAGVVESPLEREAKVIFPTVCAAFTSTASDCARGRSN